MEALKSDVLEEHGLFVDVITIDCIVVDYSKSAYRHIQNGKFGRCYPQLAKILKSQKRGSVVLYPRLVQVINKKKPSSGVHSVLARAAIYGFDSSFRNSNGIELLVFGSSFPNLQREYDVVSLDSTCGKHEECGVVMLTMDEGHRAVKVLSSPDSHIWPPHTRFLVFDREA